MEGQDGNEQRARGIRLNFGSGVGLGVGLVLLIGIGWMLDDEAGGNEVASVAVAPQLAPGVSTGPSATGGGGLAAQASPHASSDLGLSLDPEIERLRSELDEQPDRLDLRKQLTLRLLRQAQFFEAFKEAERILERSPDDVDALFVLGAVRVRMGQSSRALPLLERVLAQVPEHVPALTAKGQALLKAGHQDAAVEVWNRALELSGGSNAQVEELLRSVSGG